MFHPDKLKDGTKVAAFDRIQLAFNGRTVVFSAFGYQAETDLR